MWTPKSPIPLVANLCCNLTARSAQCLTLWGSQCGDANSSQELQEQPPFGRLWHARPPAESSRSCTASTDAMSPDGGCVPFRPIRHLFLFIGAEPNTDWLRGSGIALDSKGFVLTGDEAGAGRHPLASGRGLFASLGRTKRMIENLANIQFDPLGLAKHADLKALFSIIPDRDLKEEALGRTSHGKNRPQTHALDHRKPDSSAQGAEFRASAPRIFDRKRDRAAPVDYLLASGYQVSRVDPDSIGKAVEAFLSDSVLFTPPQQTA